MRARQLEEKLRHQLGDSLSLDEGTGGQVWLRYDTEDSDPKEQWDNYIEVVEVLRELGLVLVEPQVEHDCITGDVEHE